MGNNLLPCPFCGGVPIFETRGEKDTSSFGITVRCSKIYDCSCQLDYFDTKKEAIKAWNRRANNGMD